MKFLNYFNINSTIIPIMVLLGLGWVTPLSAFAPPSEDIQLRLQGCRNDTNTEILPNGDFLPNEEGNYTCQNPNGIEVNEFPYTDGNLGKLWKELDLVPFRLILESSSNDLEVYNVHLAADYEDSTGNSAPYLGYDKINNIQIIPSDKINGFSADGCVVTPIGMPVITELIPGGADKVIYQEIEVRHPAGATCVVDWTNRLAVGASQFPGSSLQAYIFQIDISDIDEDTSPGDIRNGRQVISINVEQMELFALRKDMSATSGTGQVWDIEKTLVSEELNLGDTCSTTPQTGDVTIRVEWSVKSTEGEDDTITIETNIYAKNNLNRLVNVDIEDKIYATIRDENIVQPESLLETELFPNVEVPAGEEVSVQNTYILNDTSPDDVLGLRDEATATFKDPTESTPNEFDIDPLVANFVLIPNGDGIQVVGEALPNVNISETEVLTGSGLSYFVSDVQGISGAFFDKDDQPISQPDSNNPIGPGEELVWKALNQSPNDCIAGENNTCFVKITKTVEAKPFTTVNGRLDDWAALVATDNSLSLTDGDINNPFSVSIMGEPLVDLAISLTVPAFDTPSSLVCEIKVTNSSDETVGTLNYPFDSSQNPQTKSQSLLDQKADVYTATIVSCGDFSGPTTKMVDLSPSKLVDDNSCSAELSFVLTPPKPPVYVEVNKITYPKGQENDWVMTLTALSGGNLDGPVVLTTQDSDPMSFERFKVDGQDLVLAPGVYEIQETLKDGWAQTASVGCQFTVLETDTSPKQCTFTNKLLGKIIVHKETKPYYGSGFDFEFRSGNEEPVEFALDDGQHRVFYDVVPGNYQIEELDPTPDFELVKLVCSESVKTNSQIDLRNRIADITLDPGEVVECTYTNRENGMVLVKKLTNGYATNDEWKFTLTGPGVNTFALTPPHLFDFDGIKLTPYEKYTLCEVDMPYGWQSFWMVDINGDNQFDERLRLENSNNDSPINYYLQVSELFNPDYGNIQSIYDDLTLCVNFIVKPGQTLFFQVDNRQVKKTEPVACYDKPIYGNYLSNDDLQANTYMLGGYHVDTCEEAKEVLDKPSSYASADHLASRLFNAKLHEQYGLNTCQQAQTAMYETQSMLESSGYSDYGHQPRTWSNWQASNLIRDLDTYIAGFMCR